DVIGQDWSTSLFHEDLEKFKQILDTAQAGTGVFGQEFRRTRKDGSIAYQTLSCKPIWHGGGLAGVECFLIDGVEPRSATPEQIEWSPRLLIVEDEALAARHLKMSLTAMGYQVAGVVNSGEEAMDAARETLPDLVLMDIMLDGEMDGVETAALIRSEMDIPVVYLTAYTDERLMERAKLTEPLGYLVKPFREEAVRATLEMALHRYTSEKGFRGELRNQVQQRTAELLTLNENLRREILERERAEQALRESRELYYTLFEQSLDPIAITTPKGDFIDANSSFIDLVGYTREELMQINAKALWSVPEDRTNWENKMAERGFSREYEWRCCRKDGSVRECLLNSTVRWTEDGTVQYQSVCRDVTERRRMEIERERLISELTAAKDALQFEATHDGLTSIWNRAEILRKIHVELTRCQREGLALGIIMIDVDHFKRINDEHGHLAG
ncbi:MAG: PAS domain S-box protein, partial [Deltaproteobacteria bacterium]|nr:PAS domain S-box protein [Deltaproteobacteria bacterium]